MNITCKAVKIHNFSARDFVTYFLICVGGVNKSLALHQLIASFPISKEQIYILSRNSSNLILTTNYNFRIYFKCLKLYPFHSSNYRHNWFDSVQLCIQATCYCFFMHYFLLNCTFCNFTLCTSTMRNWHLYWEQRANATYLLLDSTLKDF